MSTRCQVQVQGGQNKDLVVLYHHCDGYPSNILPIIYKAFMSKSRAEHGRWQWARGGKSASIICGADPTGFDIEPGIELHKDIEYFYIVTVSDEHRPKWNVKVFEVNIPWNQSADQVWTYANLKRRKTWFNKIMDGSINLLIHRLASDGQ